MLRILPSSNDVCASNVFVALSYTSTQYVPDA